MKVLLILAIAILLMALIFDVAAMKKKRAFDTVYTYDDEEELVSCLDDYPSTNTTLNMNSGFNDYVAEAMVDDSPYSTRVAFLNKLTATIMNALQDVPNDFDSMYYLKLRKNYELALTSCSQ